MTSTPTGLLSLEEFLRLPATKPYTELIDGVPEQKPVRKKRQSKAQWRLGRLLEEHAATAQGTCWPELGFKFRATTLGNLRVPDFCITSGKHRSGLRRRLSGACA